MKKTILYAAIILLLTIITVGGTYAFFTASNNSNELNLDASKFEVIYTGGTAIEGGMELVKRKEEGFNTTVNISVSEGSVKGKASLYINIEEITETISTEALNWEVYKTVDGVESFVNSGTFIDCEAGITTKKCESGDKIFIVKDYKLSTTNTAFTIYIWLNGDKVGNEVIGATFKGYIGAQSENLTADLG